MTTVREVSVHWHRPSERNGHGADIDSIALHDEPDASESFEAHTTPIHAMAELETRLGSILEAIPGEWTLQTEDAGVGCDGRQVEDWDLHIVSEDETAYGLGSENHWQREEALRALGLH